MTSSARRSFAHPLWLAVPGILLLAAFFVLPVGRMLILSIQDAKTGEFTTGHYARLMQSTLYARVLGVTFRLAFLTAILSVVLAYPIAFWLARLPTGKRNLALFLVLVPLWTSYLVKSFAWLLILGRTGILSVALQKLGLLDRPLSVLRTEGSVLIGMVHSMMPLAIMTMLPVMLKVDPNLSRAAHTMGASDARAFWEIFFPLSMPGVAAAALLVFVYSLGFFIVPAMLGGPQQSGLAQVIISQIQELLNWQFASALACVLLVAALAACFVYDRVFGLTTVTTGGGSLRPAKARSRRAGRLLAGAAGRASDAITFGRGIGPLLPWYSAAVLMFLVVPTLIIIPSAFTAAAFLEFPPIGFSWRWFRAVTESAVWMGAIQRSFLVAFVTGCVATAIGGLAALALARTRSRIAGAVFGLFLAPLIVPRIVTALGMFYLFAQIGLVATDLALVIGHTVLALPFVLIGISAVLKSYDWRLDDAAATMGANRATIIRRITVPLTAGGIAAAFIFAFITSLDELTVAIFVSGGVKTTLPKQMWDDLIVQLNPTLAAASAIMLAIIAAMLVAGELIRQPRLLQRRSQTISG